MIQKSTLSFLRRTREARARVLHAQAQDPLDAAQVAVETVTPIDADSALDAAAEQVADAPGAVAELRRAEIE